MDNVLEDLGDPVPGEGDEDDEPDDLGHRAATVDAAGGVAGIVPGVHGDEGDGEPGAEGGGDDAAYEGDDEDVAVVLGDVDDGLQHQHREGDAWDPRDEADDVEYGEDQKDDSGGIFLGPEVEAGGRDTEDDLQDTGDPDDLLREGAYSPEVGKGNYERDGEDIGAGRLLVCAQLVLRGGERLQEDDRESVKSERVVVGAAVAGDLVSMETQSRDRDEAGACREEEDRGPEIVPFRLRDFEGLVELLLLVGVRRRVVWRRLLIAGVLVVVRLLVILLLVGLLLVGLLLVVLLLIGLLLVVLLLSIGRAAEELVGGTAVGRLLCHCDRRDGQWERVYAIIDAGEDPDPGLLLVVLGGLDATRQGSRGYEKLGHWRQFC